MLHNGHSNMQFYDGNWHCAVCGLEYDSGYAKCCKVPKFMTFENFKQRYFKDDIAVINSVAFEFYDDYRTSDCKNLKEYINRTTELV